MRCIVVQSGVLTIHNNNLANEGDVDGGVATKSGGAFGSGGTTKSEKKTIVSCGAIKNERAINLSTKDLLLAFNLVVEVF
jgi:hypothetical protein